MSPLLVAVLSLLCCYGTTYARAEDPCLPNPCENDGKCIKEFGGKFSCICESLFAGDRCQTSVLDVCYGEPCGLYGVCTMEGDDFKCDCTPPYTGKNCEEISVFISTSVDTTVITTKPLDVCYDEPCGKHGVCMMEGDDYKCDCIPPYTGKNCEENGCVSNADCQNGGVCLRYQNGSNYCQCKNGTSGDVCEVVDECERNPKRCGIGSDVQCVYDLVNEKAKCTCHNASKGFDSYVKKCRVPCKSREDCDAVGCRKNRENDLRFCKCYWGTGGDRCSEEIDECKESGIDCGNNPNVTCLERGSGGSVCYCEVGGWSVAFDYDAKDCKKCECGSYNLGCEFFHGGTKNCYCDREYYQRDGKCEACECGYRSSGCSLENGTKVCNCWKPYLNNRGICEECVCGEGSTGCTFEDGKKICACKPGYFQANGICKRNCTAPGVKCQHGGKCLDDACQCLPTTSGELCEVMEWCKNDWDLYQKCGYMGDVSCMFNETSLESFCHCENTNFFYDPKLLRCKECDCKKTGHECTIENGKKLCYCKAGLIEVDGLCRTNCTSLRGLCKHGQCVDNTCKCLPGIRGDLCDIIIGCETDWDKRWTCGSLDSATCKYNETSLKSYCECTQKKYVYNSYHRECRECDCGFYGKCEWNVWGKKICNCKKDYEDKNGVCTYCTCYFDPHAIGCSFIDGIQQCECPEGFDAGSYACDDINECLNPSACPTKTICRNTDGNYTCSCDSGYRPLGSDVKRDGCTDINECFENNACPYRDTTECVNTQGSYYCQCKGGYYKLSSYMVEIEGCEKDRRSWASGYIVLLVLFIITIIGLLYLIVRNRSSS